MTELPQNVVRDLAGSYFINGPLSEEDLLKAAESVIAGRFLRQETLSKPEVTKQYMVHRLATKEHEAFLVVFMDNRHRIIAAEEMFRGTIDTAGVYPREVVKRALALNASAVIFSHNHPSGLADPSQADRNITQRLKEALSLVDIRTLDHIVVGGTETYSFAEHGLL